MRKHVVLFTLLILALTVLAAAQQDKSKRPSPPASAKCAFADGKNITVDYSSPRMHAPKTGELRKIYGGLVPYDQVWRTGANEATTFVTTADLNVGGAAVPAGNYTLFTIPGQKGWKLIINKQTGQWGTAYDPKQDLARIDMKVSALAAPLENFTIGFDSTGSACHLHLDWETTRASVEITGEK